MSVPATANFETAYFTLRSVPCVLQDTQPLFSAATVRELQPYIEHAKALFEGPSGSVSGRVGRVYADYGKPDSFELRFGAPKLGSLGPTAR